MQRPFAKSGTGWNTRNTLVQVFILVTRSSQYFWKDKAFIKNKFLPEQLLPAETL
ncbi:hypothetical protein KHS38_00295 [Mucilaginibacter sp. Bleaf8]|uniref:hypothetical protein n=1 Tax=Mucilaginibacter sp. Bleaf8 TaxID=2834430 RepID=UPI001BCE7C38|nr:hypothetical protein [Mucilaginibacter sp. Bleaf8]MBS7562829.1 hypothetical protein [Mucilaginibacter sp. Bleaf8]